MASGQQLAEEYVRRFTVWKESKTDEGFRNLVARGVLSRKDIATECGFSGSVLNQNPRVRDALKLLEDELRARNVLPPAAGGKGAPASTPTAPAQSPARAAREVERLSRLEQENATLKAENGELKRLLSRYAVLQEVLAETGRLPR